MRLMFRSAASDHTLACSASISFTAERQATSDCVADTNWLKYEHIHNC